jgi:hypothetical protein
MGSEDIAELSARERPGGVGMDADVAGEGDLLVGGRPMPPRCVDTGDGRAVEVSGLFSESGRLVEVEVGAEGLDGTGFRHDVDRPAVGLLLDEDDVAGIAESDRIAPVEPGKRQPAQVASAEEVDALGHDAVVLAEEHSQPLTPGAVP